jgi:uncharacterized damage-inducible protein DinB
VKTIDHLRELYLYNEWANQRIAASLSQNDCERALQIFAHLLTTELEYFERIGGKDSTLFNFWPDLNVIDCGELLKSTSTKYIGLLDKCGDEALDKPITYKNSRGVQFTNTLEEILTHVLMHSAIHRGNIILKLRESGFEPPQTDYIIYLRGKKKN